MSVFLTPSVPIYPTTTREFLRGGVTLPFPLSPPLLFGLDSPASFFCNTYCTEHYCLRFLVLTRENLLFCRTVSKKRKNEMKKEKQKRIFFLSSLCGSFDQARPSPPKRETQIEAVILDL